MAETQTELMALIRETQAILVPFAAERDRCLAEMDAIVQRVRESERALTALQETQKRRFDTMLDDMDSEQERWAEAERTQEECRFEAERAERQKKFDEVVQSQNNQLIEGFVQKSNHLLKEFTAEKEWLVDEQREQTKQFAEQCVSASDEIAKVERAWDKALQESLAGIEAGQARLEEFETRAKAQISRLEECERHMPTTIEEQMRKRWNAFQRDQQVVVARLEASRHATEESMQAQAESAGQWRETQRLELQQLRERVTLEREREIAGQIGPLCKRLADVEADVEAKQQRITLVLQDLEEYINFAKPVLAPDSAGLRDIPQRCERGERAIWRHQVADKILRLLNAEQMERVHFSIPDQDIRVGDVVHFIPLSIYYAYDQHRVSIINGALKRVKLHMRDNGSNILFQEQWIQW